MAEQLLKGNGRAAGTYGDMGTGPHLYLANNLTLSYLRGLVGQFMLNSKVYPHQYFRYSGAPKNAGIVEPAGLPTCLLKLP